MTLANFRVYTPENRHSTWKLMVRIQAFTSWFMTSFQWFLPVSFWECGKLVGGWTTPLKNMSQNGNLPQIGVTIKKYLKPPPSFSRLHEKTPLKSKGLSFPKGMTFCRQVTFDNSAHSFEGTTPKSCWVGQCNPRMVAMQPRMDISIKNPNGTLSQRTPKKVAI